MSRNSLEFDIDRESTVEGIKAMLSPTELAQRKLAHDCHGHHVSDGDVYEEYVAGSNPGEAEEININYKCKNCGMFYDTQPIKDWSRNGRRVKIEK